MTSHPYLDLQQGNVENYCMIVPKAEVPQWYEQGWLPHYAVGLSRREANRAYMIYGFMRFGRDVLLFSRPEYLAAKSPIGRKIVGFCTHLGTYGMDGPGFFGLLLDTDEYLVYSAWHAGYSTLLDNRAVKIYPYSNTAVRCWVGSLNGAEWDELSPCSSAAKSLIVPSPSTAAPCSCKKTAKPIYWNSCAKTNASRAPLIKNPAWHTKTEKSPTI